MGLLDGTPTPPETLSTDERLREHQKKAGRSGGLSRSDTKRKSSAANLQKARLKRWPGRELAHAAASSPLSQSHEASGGGPGTLQTERGPGGPSPSGNQSNSGYGEQKDGGPNHGGHPVSGDGELRPLPSLSRDKGDS